MDTIAQWLGQITWPLVSRALAALGFGYVTYEGASTALNAALASAKGAFGGMAGDVFLMVAKFGFFDFMSITSGGILSGLAWMQLKKLAIHTNPS